MVADKLPMLKKVLVSSLIAVSTVSLVAGCTTTSKVDNVIPLTENYDIPAIPSWSESSLKILQQEGWTIQEQQESALREDNVALPQTFYAKNKDGSCVVKFDSYVTTVRKASAGDDYLTRDTGYSRSDASSASTDFSEDTANIQIEDSTDKLQMLELVYSFENKISKPMSEEESKAFQSQANATGTAPDPGYTVDGMNQEAYMVRVTEQTIKNPLYDMLKNEKVTEATKSALKPEGNSVISMSYACQKKEIDKKLWERLKADAKINFDPLPTILSNKK